MSKDYKALTYIADENISDTILWLLNHQDVFESFQFDVLSQELSVTHAAGRDIIRVGTFLNATYGILVTFRKVPTRMISLPAACVTDNSWLSTSKWKVSKTSW